MTKCAFHECDNHPLSGAEFCWDHLSDRETYTNRIIAMLKKGDDLSGYNLRKVSLKNVELANARLRKANMSQVDLSGAHLFDADMEGAELVGTNLSRSELSHCILRSADLTKANLSHSRLWNADLKRANLTECDLSEADLWNANLTAVKLWHTTFASAKFLSMKSFCADKGIWPNPRIDESGLLSAEESYRDLKRYFTDNGMHNDASWAAFKEKTMERCILKKKGDLHYLPSLVMGVLCGYGEKPHRIVLSAFLTIFLFAFLYSFLNAIQSSNDPSYILRWADYIYVSAITFTTVGYGDFIPKGSSLFRLLAATEAFSGVFLAGLFVFTLARKYSAR